MALWKPEKYLDSDLPREINAIEHGVLTNDYLTG
jgi:hypothetical protein